MQAQVNVFFTWAKLERTAGGAFKVPVCAEDVGALFSMGIFHTIKDSVTPFVWTTCKSKPCKTISTKSRIYSYVALGDLFFLAEVQIVTTSSTRSVSSLLPLPCRLRL